MASASDMIQNNTGIHQLDKDAYPPADSDDEDSFVVLDSYGPRTLQMEVEPISTSGIEKTLDSITETLSKHGICPGVGVKDASLSISTSGIEKTLDSPTDILSKLGMCPGVGVKDASLQKSMINGTSFSSISGEEIQKNVDNLIAENTKLKDTLAQNNVTMKIQVEKITKWQEEVQQVQESHKRKFAEMKVIIQDLRNENSKLKNELAQAMKGKEVHVVDAKTETVTLTKRSDNILQFELEAAQKKIREMEKALDIIINEKQNLSTEMSDYKKQIAKYEEEINALKSSNDKVSSDKSLWVITESELNKELESMKLECETLRSANNNLTQTLLDANSKQEVLNETIKTKDLYLTTTQSGMVELQEALANTKEQLMSSQMHITELKEQHTKEALKRESENAEAQKKQDRQNRMFQDEIAALRTQMDLYQRDYETERELKTVILREKNALVDEIQLLQNRNAELIEENDQLRRGYVPVRAEDVNQSPSNNSTYVCPRCNFTFKDYPTLANHVEHCLELDALP